MLSMGITRTFLAGHWQAHEERENRTYRETYTVLLQRWRSKYPSEKSLECKIFSVLADKYAKGGSSDKYDIFNMPTITEAELLRVIKEFGVANEYQALQKLVEDGTLDVRNSTTVAYTYGVPAYFLLSHLGRNVVHE